MSQLPREELASILFEEVEGYLPLIRQKLTTLLKTSNDKEALQETHRLFHNIKGAASQVDFRELSAAAMRSENLLASTIEEQMSLGGAELNFLYTVHDRIEEFCYTTDKSRGSEKNHFESVLASPFGLHSPDQTSLYEDDMFESDWTASFDNEESHEAGDPSAEIPQLDTIRQECLDSLRSIIPLLQELTECTDSRFDSAVPPQLLGIMSKAVSTLATCSRKAGLRGQYQLLSDFETLLNKLSTSPSLVSPETPALLKEFITYLDVLFSLDPRQGEAVAGRIMDKFSTLSALLVASSESEQSAFSDQDEMLSEEGLDEIFDQQEELLLAETADPELFGSGDEDDFVDALTDTALSDKEESPQYSEEELELFAIFQAECEEHLQVINHTLNTLESKVLEPTDFDPGLLDTVAQMRRAVHTLKGAAGMTGFDYLSSCAHSLEDLLDWLHDDSDNITPDDVLVIADGIDIIERLSNDREGIDRTSSDIYSEKVETFLKTRNANGVSPDIQSADLAPTAPGAVDFVELPDSHKVASVQPEADSALPGTAGNVRVKLDDLDELAGIEGELVVARGSIEKLLEKLSQSLGVLNTTRDSLNRKTQELEVGFEAQSLYGFGPAPASGAPGTPGYMDEPSQALSEFDPIELDRYSQLNLIIRSLNEISIDVNALYSEMTGVANEIRGQVSKQQLSMGLMQEKLMRIRMTPLSSISRILYRTVRQTANNLEKDVRLTITGEDVYMDRYIWSRTLDPLMHILRNCVDHGIEDSLTRQEAGKLGTGQISITAEQRNRYVVIRISDDGKGIDIDLLKQTLASEGIIDPDASYDDDELLHHLFRPSFSTKQDVSQISGRGVGLDVVLKNIQELRGSVKIENRPGQGVTFELNIPITLSINRAIIVGIGGRQFAVPIQDIVEVHKFTREEVDSGEENKATWNDTLIDIVELAPRLQLTGKPSEDSINQNLVLIIDNDGTKQALQIDSIIEQREIVIKDLGSHLRYVRGINGVTVTGEGTVIPILNLQELAAEKSLIVRSVEQAEPQLREEPLQVLIVDDSISVRYSISKLVEGQSWQAHQAVDGIDAMEQLETLTPDVIILDIEMPRMNGYEFLAARGADQKLSSIPVVMLTSRASEKHRKKAEELGVTSYVTKPYQENEFVDLLERLAANRTQNI